MNYCHSEYHSEYCCSEFCHSKYSMTSYNQSASQLAARGNHICKLNRFFDKIWQILTTVQCRARTYAQLLLVFVIMMTSVDASQPTEVHIHRKRILPVFSGKKSRKNHFLPTFVLLLTKIDDFLWNVLQWYLVWNSKKSEKKTKRFLWLFICDLKSGQDRNCRDRNHRL